MSLRVPAVAVAGDRFRGITDILRAAAPGDGHLPHEPVKGPVRHLLGALAGIAAVAHEEADNLSTCAVVAAFLDIGLIAAAGLIGCTRLSGGEKKGDYHG